MLGSPAFNPPSNVTPSKELLFPAVKPAYPILPVDCDKSIFFVYKLAEWSNS